MPPLITTFSHLHRLLGALHHQNGLHRWATPAGKSCINSWLERHGLVLAEAAIGRDHRLGFTVDQTITQGFG
ncbi:MAG: Uncharacterised protein [Synechococcus sp. MIT S9220]|nr:MAG: Uncharacterised protein [Synechococcus sp. MIT S9220]